MSFSSRPPESSKSASKLQNQLQLLARDLTSKKVESSDPVQYPSVQALSELYQAIEVCNANEQNIELASNVTKKLRDVVSAVLMDVERFAKEGKRGYAMRLINALADSIPDIEAELSSRQIYYTLLDVIGSDPAAEGLFSSTTHTLTSFYSQTSKNSDYFAKDTTRPTLRNNREPRQAKTELGMGKPEQAAIEEAQAAARAEAAKLAGLRPSKLPDAKALGIFNVDDEPTTNGNQEPTASNLAATAEDEEPAPVSAPQDDVEDGKDPEITNVFLNPIGLLGKIAQNQDSQSAVCQKRPSPVPMATVYSAHDMQEAVELALQNGGDVFAITGNHPEYKEKIKKPTPEPTPKPAPEQAISPLPEPLSLKVDPLPPTIAKPGQYPSGVGPISLSGGRPVVPLTPLSIPTGLILPSSYLPKVSEKSSSNGKILVKDVTEFRNTSEQPKKPIITRMRAVIAASVMSVLGLGIVASAVERSTIEPKLGSASGAQLANTSSPKPQEPKKEVAPEKKEVKAETGFYRMDTSYAGYQNYLAKYKKSSGLIQNIKNFSEEVRVIYRQDPVEVKKLRDEGKLVMTGAETEEEQKLIMFEGLLQVSARKHYGKNNAVKDYFENAGRALATYKKTGVWDSMAIGYGSKELYQIVGKPLKFKDNPNVAGYTFDNNPESNLALSRIKASAPTYYKLLIKTGDELKAETDPSKFSRFDDPTAIKKFTCDRIVAVAKTYKNADVEGGVAYMNGQWCKPNDTNPDNYLNQVVQKTIPKPATNQPASAVQPQAQPNQPAPQGTFLPNIAPLQAQPSSTPAETPKAKSGFWNKLKSIFSSEQKSTETPASQPVMPQKKPVSSSTFVGISTNDAELAAKARKFRRLS